MGSIDGLLTGFAQAITWYHLAMCFAGVFLGTFIGVLPGIGPTATISILLPLTYHWGDPVGSLIMLAGVYYGSQYGSSTTSILMNIPGEPSSMVTALDGYQMTRRGHAGPALAVSAIGSFVAGIFATLLIGLVSIPLIKISLRFGPAEYANLMLFAMIASVFLSNADFVKGIAMILTGVLLGTVGVDLQTGLIRYAFDIPSLADGINVVVLLIGLFGISEILYNILEKRSHTVFVDGIQNLWPSRDQWRKATPAIFRGTVIGSILGILPGAGAIVSSIASYIVEKKISKTPQEFGHGAIQGVAGPESANNAGAQTSFIPMLTLGLPMTPIMALLCSAMIMQGIQPGPGMISERPELFWGLIASFLIGNFMLLILNLPLISIWVKLLSIPTSWLYPMVIVISVIGVYSINHNMFDVLLLIPVGIIGLYLKRWGCEVPPLILGFVLSKNLEEYLGRALTLNRGDISIFWQSDISRVILGACVMLIFLMLFSKVRLFRKSVDES